MNHTIVEISNWKRRDLFQHYIQKMPIVMSLTVDLSVAPLLDYAKKHGYSFYPCMLWVVSKVLNAHEEFKYSWDEGGNLIRWDEIWPSYTEFHPEDESFTKLVIPYSTEISAFHKEFYEAREKYQNLRGIIEGQPKNSFDVSCLPWVRYRHFDLHVFDEGKFLAPVVTWGKYEVECKGTIMPLTLNIHHAVADGFHLSRFFTEVQALIDELGKGERICLGS